MWHCLAAQGRPVHEVKEVPRMWENRPYIHHFPPEEQGIEEVIVRLPGAGL